MSFVALSELLGANVRDVDGTARGRVRDIAVAPQDHPTRIAYLIVKAGEIERLVPAASIKTLGPTIRTEGDDAGWERYAASDGMLLLKRDLLDQQIIDVHGRKVVRVNDVELDSTPVNTTSSSTSSPSTSGRAAPFAGSPKASSRHSRCAHCSSEFRRG